MGSSFKWGKRISEWPASCDKHSRSLTVEAAAADDRRLIVNSSDLVLSVVCNYMVWMKCGAALFFSKFRNGWLWPWLRAHGTRMQYVKSMTSLLIFCCRLLDGPQHMSFRVGAGPAITKNKLNNNRPRTKVP